MSKVDPSKITIICINTIKSAINTDDSFLNAPVDFNKASVGFSQNSRFNFEKKIIAVRLNIILEGVNNENTPVGVKGEFCFEFQLHIDNLEVFIEQDKNDNSIKVSGELGASIMGIVYSTARGIVLERTQNTYLKGAILPVIDPAILLSQSPTCASTCRSLL
jgi:hypothetical protein